MSAASDRLDALALRAISEAGPLSNAALARIIGCSPHAAYDAAFRLARDGKIEREGDGCVVSFRWCLRGATE